MRSSLIWGGKQNESNKQPATKILMKTTELVHAKLK